MLVSRLPVAAIAACLLLLTCACSTDRESALSAPDAYARMQAGTLNLIDIRHAEEWRKTGVARGALRIDMTSTQGEAGFVSQVETRLGGNRQAPIGLISLAGNRSENARQALRDAGFSHVYNIREGMMGSSAGPGWIARGLPIDPCGDC